MNLGFLHVKITSVSQGNLIWWWRRGLLHKLPRLYMCRTVSWGLGSLKSFQCSCMHEANFGFSSRALFKIKDIFHIKSVQKEMYVFRQY